MMFAVVLCWILYERTRKLEPAVTALRELVLRVDAAELADGSSLDTLAAHAVLNKLDEGGWL